MIAPTSLRPVWVSSVNTPRALGTPVVSTISRLCPGTGTGPEGVLLIITSGQLCKQTSLHMGTLLSGSIVLLSIDFLT